MAVWPTDDPTGTHWSEDPDAPYDVEPREYLDAADAADLAHDEQASSDADTWEGIF
jgi:hypothetical protein